MVVLREVVGHAGHAGVDVGAAQLLGRHDLAGRGLHERRTAQKDRSLLLDDDRLVRHRGHVGAARGARAHDDGDLRNAFRGHRRLVVEDPAEVVAIRKHVDLVREVRPARVDQIDARQAVLAGDLLRAEMLLDGERVIRAALDRRVVADDDALAARHATDAGDDAGGGDRPVVHSVCRQLRELEEGRAGIEERADALARQQLAAGDVLRARRFASALLDALDLGPKIRDQCRHRLAILRERRVAGVELRFDHGHGRLDRNVTCARVSRDARRAARTARRRSPSASAPPRRARGRGARRARRARRRGR